jgi:soluble lytic murein transglycosylase
MRRPRRALVALAAIAGAVGIAAAWVAFAQPDWLTRLRYPLHYERIIAGHAGNYGLDGALIAAVIYRESRFDADVVSEAGAIGLMQLLPRTAEGIATLTGGTRFVVDDLYRPELNVRYGAFYLRRLVQKYGDVGLALAAYNAGQANVDRWLAAGSAIAFPETREFVADVLRLRDLYRSAYGSRLGG